MYSLPKVNISLTSYPRRIAHVERTLQPLFKQTVRPDRILLWLSNDEFPQQEASLPESLIVLQKTIPEFSIRWVDGNNKSHDKYLHCMQEFPDDITILVDDDLVYSTTLVQCLLDAHFRFPEAVIARRSHLVTLDEDRIAHYADWELGQTRFVNTPRFDLLATSGAGTLYPPHAFAREAFDVESLQALAPDADDLWLMLWLVLAERPVVVTGDPSIRYVEGTQDEALYYTNLKQGGNDVWLARLFECYPLFEEKLTAAVRDRMTSEMSPAEQECVEVSAEPDGLMKRLIRKLHP